MGIACPKEIWVRRVALVGIAIIASSALTLPFFIFGRSAIEETGSGLATIPTALSTPTQVSAPQPNSNGYMERANVQGTGVYITKGVRQLTGLKWQFKANETGPIPSAVIQGSVVYFVADDGRLHAVDAGTGTENWDFKAEFSYNSAPAIAGNLIFVGAWEAFYALDHDTGQVKWTFRPESGSKDGYYESPTVNDGIVYFGGWHEFYAIDSKTGREKWKLKLSGIITSVPVVYDGTVYIGTYTPDGREDTYLYAIDSKTGREKWKVSAIGGTTGSAAVVDGLVYVGTWNNGLLALEASTGKERWGFNPGSGLLPSPAVAYDTVYVAGGDGGSLYAIDSKTGQEKWKLQESAGLYSDPVIADGIVYFMTTEVGLGAIIGVGQATGYIHAVDAQSGQEQWKFSVPGITSRAPAIADGVVYFGSDDGTFYAVK